MLLRRISKGMAHMSKLNFLESYAMFMGKAQLVEFALKKILRKRYRYGKKKLEKMTLGAAITALDQKGLRKDFVSLLWQLNTVRIAMAHNFLAEHLRLASLLGRRFGHLSFKPLRPAEWKVEETIQVFDYLNQNRMLYQRQRKAY